MLSSTAAPYASSSRSRYAFNSSYARVTESLQARTSPPSPSHAARSDSMSSISCLPCQLPAWVLAITPPTRVHVAGIDVVAAIAGKQAALLANTLIAAAGLACAGIPVGIPRGTERHLRIRIAPFPTSSPAGLTGSHRHSYQREAPGCDGEA